MNLFKIELLLSAVLYSLLPQRAQFFRVELLHTFLGSETWECKISHILKAVIHVRHVSMD